MKFLTNEEARTRAARTLGANGHPVLPIPGCELRREVFEKEPGYTYFARAREIVSSLDYFDWCLLWVVLTEVWPSNENLHLYYRLRESYGNRDQVGDQPGLVALHHEEVDLVTFVHLGMMFGWEMYLVTSHDYGRAFISRDGYFELSSNTPSTNGAKGYERTDRPAT